MSKTKTAVSLVVGDHAVGVKGQGEQIEWVENQLHALPLHRGATHLRPITLSRLGGRH